ncbi:MAG: mandelate racemase/muconate lactonizing enzyme family protein [Solirubrobacterales bacterium]
MRIASAEAFPIALPFRREYVTATGRLDHREMLILRLDSGEGIAGWGDAVPMSLRGGAGTSEVAAALDAGCEALIGLELDQDAGRAAADALARASAAGAQGPALSAIDVALLDLLGRRDAEPAWRLLGASEPRTVLCNATIGADEPAAAAQAAADAARMGFGTVKVKAGDIADVERVLAVRAAIGPETKLRIDANGSWTVPEARSRLAAMGPATLELAEQPCATVPDLAELRADVGVPIVADESINDRGEAEAALAAGAIDAATLKLAKVGGPRAALAIARSAPAYLSSALDSVLGVAAAVHTAVAMRNDGFAAGLAHGLATSALFADNVGDDGPFTGPEIEPGPGPGLGIEIDRDAIERLRLK